jgi:hypothetical protein
MCILCDTLKWALNNCRVVWDSAARRPFSSKKIFYFVVNDEVDQHADPVMLENLILQVISSNLLVGAEAGNDMDQYTVYIVDTINWKIDNAIHIQ